MLPALAANIPVTVTAQPSLVATAMPGNIATRAPIDAVPPSNSNVALNNNTHGGGNVTVAPVQQAPAQPLFQPLSTLMAPSYNASSASLSASAMFAAQAMGQGESADNFMAVYDEMIAISEVKYKPSNAGVPQPAASNAFSKALEAERSSQQVNVQTAVRSAQQQISAPAQSVASQMAAAVPKLQESKPQPTINDMRLTGPVSSFNSGNALTAVNAYRATTVRNAGLKFTPVEAVEPEKTP